EDGIRDFHVTGVQTCALPIFISKVKRFSTYAETPLQRLEQALHPWVAFFILPLFALANAGIELPTAMSGVFASQVTMGVFLGLRSEERRGGKECECRVHAYEQ